ncbi:MAG: rod shape-determining protein RodA [Candidatus Omnitrophota bacterium]
MLRNLQTKAAKSPVGSIVLCLLLLSIVSLTLLYSSLHQGGELKDQAIFYKQIMWLAFAWICFIGFSFLNYRLWFDFAIIFYILNILLLIAVEFFGKSALGAQRWLDIGGFSFQPSEVSKITTIFILARLFSSPESKGLWRGVLVPFGLVILNVALIAKQPDLGTALILVFLFFALGFVSSLRKRYLVILLLVALIASPFAWNHLKSYQKKRLIVFLNPNVEPLGAGYTIIQSKIAIGSGRICGKGFLSGTQNQFNFLPERHTDFIFTVLAEEWGLLGSLFLLLIYFYIFNKIIDIVNYLKDPFARLISFGIAFLFFLHVFINIGMTLGILPVVGLPLLFLSYGGTHLIVSFILLGVFANIYRQ